ncbi:MAG: acylphosphatase [Candidatus Methanoperedens sp.]|nr:acylphosphatase [Candidatus Methanoperedens sp.]
MKKTGRKLKLAGYVKNLKDGTVQIHCKGDEKAISEFKKKINVKKPDAAPLIVVEGINEKKLARGKIKQKNFEELYDETSAEMSQGFSTGMKYINLFNNDTQANLNLLRSETKENFHRMDEKYDAISKAMFAVVEGMEERNKTFEIKIEKTNKSIESLLKILTQKKS